MVIRGLVARERASIDWRSCSFRGMGCLGPPGGGSMILAYGARFDRGAEGGFAKRGAIVGLRLMLK